MTSFDKAYFNLGYIDTLSYGDSFVHRLDPRVKLIVTIVFIVSVVSFPKYEILRLIPFFLFPVFMMTAGNIPSGFVLKRMLFVSPFVIMTGIFNPILDSKTFHLVSGLTISAGWVSFFSIMLRFLLTVSSALLLIATTSFYGVCHALNSLGLPRAFVIQMVFLYRYTFVLAGEAMRMVRGVTIRSSNRGMGMGTFVNLLGVLFLRTMKRSEAIYQAMCSRGFDGEVRLLRSLRIRLNDLAFAIISITLFIIFRWFDIPGYIGGLVIR
jgi:cobalt/nickel transport system permease protein